jgi:hypothetical protein
VLESKVVLVAFVEASEDIDFVLSVIAAGADARSYLML